MSSLFVHKQRVYDVVAMCSQAKHTRWLCGVFIREAGQILYITVDIECKKVIQIPKVHENVSIKRVET